MDELLRDFIVETNQHLEEAATQLVLFERDPTDASLIAKIFRLVHTIKGTCSFLGLTRLQHIAHAGETMIGELRNGAAPTQTSVTVVLAAIDRIKMIVEDVERTGVEPEGDDADMIKELDAQAEMLAASLRGEPVVEANPVAAAPVSEAPVTAAVSPAPIAEPAPVVTAPAPKAPDPAPVSAPAPAPAAKTADKGAAKGQAAANARSSETIRVAVDAIERMMQLVSELVLTRNQLLELTRHRQDDTVKTPLQRLSSLTTDLQDAVMRARMQPVERLYANLPRLIRELSTECGKKIDLVTEGADTELDRQLIEILRDPLTHMIRNSADHGLENPAERLAAGKPETGEIRVSASHEAGQITITIADDGRGLDIEKIKKKLLSNGTVTEQELAKLSEDEIFKFIFAPGFSTAKTVTNVSGRGVGMDVVRSNIESIGGSISMQSKLGKGTKFSMRIPLTLAIAPALIVEASGQRFALPQHAVVEAVGVGANSGHVIDKVQNALVLRLREEVVPVIDMSQVLGLSSARQGNEQLVVIMRVGGESFGVIVDKVADVQEVVVKPLSASLAHLKVFTGHTILGDGSVVLILDPGGLAMSIGIEKGGEKKREKKDAAAADKTRLVLFRAGAGVVKVLPVSLIARIEMVEPSRIEHADGRLTMIHQDRLMPLVPVGSTNFDASRSYPVLVITDGDLTVGLLVDEIVDIIEETLDVQLSSGGYDTIGAAVIRGHAVEFIDVTSYLQGIASSVNRQNSNKQASRSQVLLVHDDSFARDFLSPMLAAAGYRVTSAASAKEALQIIDRGSHVDAVVTSTELAEMTGNELASAVRRSAPAREVPVIGLIGEEDVYDEADSDELTLRVQANDRQSLLAGLSDALKAMKRAEKRSALKSKKGVAA